MPFKLLFFAFSLISNPLHFSGLSPEDGVELSRERVFEGSGLYGFMNGGSELFLEYGFLQLLEQRFTYQGISFIAEYYLMDSPQNAYGIYSIHTFRCRRADERFPIECLTPGLLQLYHGHLYISLKCMDRTVDSQPMLDALAELIVNKNPITESDNALSLSPFPPPHSGVVYYVCGDLGLSQAYISLAQRFASYTHYAMWLRINPETQEADFRLVPSSVANPER